jgi:hypothetical protein
MVATKDFLKHIECTIKNALKDNNLTYGKYDVEILIDSFRKHIPTELGYVHIWIQANKHDRIVSSMGLYSVHYTSVSVSNIFIGVNILTELRKYNINEILK